MINVDFKTFSYWATDDAGSQEISFKDVNPKELYDWLSKPGNYLQGGYCIELNGKAWNGDDNGEPGGTEYFIDHIDGALCFLRTINYFNSDHAMVGEMKQNIWQCDGSTLELTLIDKETLLLSDEVFECEDVLLPLGELSHAFQEATETFINCITQVIALCPAESSLKKDLECQLEHTKKFVLV